MAAVLPRRRRVPRLASWTLLSLALQAGCSDEAAQAPGGTDSGTVLVAGDPLPFSASAATALAGEAACASGRIDHAAYVLVVGSERPALCADWLAGGAVAGERTIELLLVDPEAAGATLALGAYPVTLDPVAEGRHALVAVHQADALCRVSAVRASTGTVAVSSWSAGRVAGTVVANLPSGSQVIGAFDATACAAVAAADLCSGEVAAATSTCAP
jgi:hypothetical protein